MSETKKTTKQTKPRRLRSRPGIHHRYLTTPDECVGAQRPGEQPSAVCHVVLLCQRCKLCAYHCSCAAELEAFVPQQRWRKREKAETDQLPLCERPVLRVAASVWEPQPPKAA